MINFNYLYGSKSYFGGTYGFWDIFGNYLKIIFRIAWFYQTFLGYLR